MLRSEAVGEADGRIQRFRLDEPAVVLERPFDELAPRKFRELFRYFLLHGLDEFGRRREEPDPFVAGAVFRLREKVGGDVGRLRRIIGEHEHLAWSRQQVDRDIPEEEALGRDDVGIARTEDFLHRLDHHGAERHGGDGLGTAHPIDLGGAGLFYGEEKRGVDAAVLAAGSADDDLGTTRDFGQRDGHQRRRDERRGAAGDVDADALKRIEFLPDRRAVAVRGGPCFAEALAGEDGDVLRRFGHRCPQGFVGLEGGGEQFGGRHGKPGGVGQLGSIELGGELKQRSVSAFLHGMDNGAGALLDGGIKQAGGRAERGDPAGKVAVVEPENLHAPRG